MIGALPYDGTASNLVTGLDTLVKIFDIAQKRDLPLTVSVIPDNTGSEQASYLKEVIERVKLAQELTHKYLSEIESTNRHSVQRALTKIYRKGKYEIAVPRVKGTVDLGYCLGFIESEHGANSYMHLGEVASMTLGRTLLLPHEVDGYIDAQTKPEFGFTRQELNARKRQLLAETTFPLFFTTKDYRTHAENTSPEMRLLELVFDKKVGQTTFDETNIHEARHLQDVILGTMQFRMAGIPAFIETQAHLYADGGIEGFNRDVMSFKQYMNTCKKTAEERLLNYKRQNATTLQSSEAEYLKNVNTRISDGLYFFDTVANTIIAENRKPGSKGVQRKNSKALSYIFSTSLPTNIRDRLILACEEYRQRAKKPQK